MTILNEEKLKEDIVSSFPKWNPKSKDFFPSVITRDDMETIRDNIYFAVDEEIAIYVGIIMYDLLNYHPKDFINDGGYNDFISYLNANELDDDKFDETHKEILDHYNIPMPKNNDIKDIRQKRAKSFDVITNEQAACILSWLYVAKQWECSIFREDDFKYAIDFWKTRI